MTTFNFIYPISLPSTK